MLITADKTVLKPTTKAFPPFFCSTYKGDNVKMLLCKFKNLPVTLTMLMTVNAFPQLLWDPKY